LRILDFLEENIRKRYQKDLLGGLGNLVARSTSKSLNPDSSVPSPPGPIVDTREAELREKLMDLPSIFERHIEGREFNQAFGVIFDTIYMVNKYFHENAPWQLGKTDDEQVRLQTVLFYTIESVRIAGILLQPVMPRKMAELLDKVGVRASERTFDHARFGFGWPAAEGGQRMLGETVAEVLFPRLSKS